MAAPAIRGVRRSDGTKAFHERATRYFDRFLYFKDDDELGSSWAALIEEKNELLCDTKLWEEFSGWLVHHAVQLANPNQRIQDEHAKELLSALTTQVREAFPSHATWSSGFSNWYSGLYRGVGAAIRAREHSKGLKPPGATVSINKTALKKLCDRFFQLGDSAYWADSS
jgi:hypothetical protein